MINPSEGGGQVPRLTVIIVNHESWSDVLELTAALEAQPEFTSGRSRIVVVDNASRGSMPEAFSLHRVGQRVIFRPDNGGFAAGVNAGWRVAQSPWLLVLNPDVEVASGFLGQVFERLDQYETNSDGPPGIVGFGLRNPDGSPQGSVGIFPNLARTIREQFIPRSRRKYQPGWRIRSGPVDWVTGACMLVNSSHDRRARRNGRGFLPLSRGSGVQPRGAEPRLARGIRPERDGHSPTSIAESADLAHDAGDHPAQQAALFPQALAALAVREFGCDRVGSRRRSRASGRGCCAPPGRHPGVGHDRGDHPRPARGPWTAGPRGSRRSPSQVSSGGESGRRQPPFPARRGSTCKDASHPPMPNASSRCAGRAADRFANALTGLLAVVILGLL